MTGFYACRYSLGARNTRIFQQLALRAKARKHHITRAYVLAHILQDIDMVRYQYQWPAISLSRYARQQTLHRLVLLFGALRRVEKRGHKTQSAQALLMQKYSSSSAKR